MTEALGGAYQTEKSDVSPEDFIDITPEQKQWVLSEIARLEAQPHSGIKNLLILTAFQYLESKIQRID